MNLCPGAASAPPGSRCLSVCLCVQLPPPAPPAGWTPGLQLTLRRQPSPPKPRSGPPLPTLLLPPPRAAGLAAAVATGLAPPRRLQIFPEGSQKGGQETSNTRTNTAPSPREFPGGVASAFKIELEILRVLQFCLSRVSSSLSLKAHFLVPPGPAAIVLAWLHGGLCWAAGLLTPQSPYPPRPRAAWGRVHLPPPS